MAFEQDKELALETVKMWFREQDAAYLAKEDIVVHWNPFNTETKRGEWTKIRVRELCRIIKATRAGFAAMRFVKPEVILLAAQEEGRAYRQGVKSRSTVPPEYFNFERAGHLNNFELLTLCVLQTLVGRGMNMEAHCLGTLMDCVFKTKGYVVPSRTFRWKLIRAVADEAGIKVRDRLDRITIYGVGRFVAVQIEGINDTIKLHLSEEELNSITAEVILAFDRI